MEKFEKRKAHPLERYSRAVSEMYSQFKKREAHPMEKYIGRSVNYRGEKLEVVGYSVGALEGFCLIADATLFGGWCNLDVCDVVFKRCESYCYVSINDLIEASEGEDWVRLRDGDVIFKKCENYLYVDINDLIY